MYLDVCEPFVEVEATDGYAAACSSRRAVAGDWLGTDRRSAQAATASSTRPVSTYAAPSTSGTGPWLPLSSHMCRAGLSTDSGPSFPGEIDSGHMRNGSATTTG